MQQKYNANISRRRNRVGTETAPGVAVRNAPVFNTMRFRGGSSSMEKKERCHQRTLRFMQQLLALYLFSIITYTTSIEGILVASSNHSIHGFCPVMHAVDRDNIFFHHLPDPCCHVCPQARIHCQISRHYKSAAAFAPYAVFADKTASFTASAMTFAASVPARSTLVFTVPDAIAYTVSPSAIV